MFCFSEERRITEDKNSFSPYLTYYWWYTEFDFPGKEIIICFSEQLKKELFFLDLAC